MRLSATAAKPGSHLHVRLHLEFLVHCISLQNISHLSCVRPARHALLLYVMELRGYRALALPELSIDKMHTMCVYGPTAQLALAREKLRMGHRSRGLLFSVQLIYEYFSRSFYPPLPPTSWKRALLSAVRLGALSVRSPTVPVLPWLSRAASS